MYSLKRLKNGFRSTILYVIDSTADLLSTLGTLSSVFSGMTFAGSNYLDFGAGITYYANGDIHANSTTISAFNGGSHTYTRTNDVIEDKYVGSNSLKLDDFLTSHYVRMISLIALSNGMVLKSFGNILHLWVQGEKDRLALGNELYQPPTWQEYSTQMTHGIVSAPATAAISASVTALVLHFHFRPINWEYYYPSNGPMIITKQGISKPMSTYSNEQTRTYPIHSFQIPGLECKSESKFIPQGNHASEHPEISEFECNPKLEFFNLTFSANIRMGVAYGVTISKENTPATHINSQQVATIVTGAIGGACLYSAGRFFKSKAQQQRSERLQHILRERETQNSCSTIEDDRTEVDISDTTDSSLRVIVVR